MSISSRNISRLGREDAELTVTFLSRHRWSFRRSVQDLQRRAVRAHVLARVRAGATARLLVTRLAAIHLTRILHGEEESVACRTAPIIAIEHETECTEPAIPGVRIHQLVFFDFVRERLRVPIQLPAPAPEDGIGVAERHVEPFTHLGRESVQADMDTSSYGHAASASSSARE